jgi:spermidine/putrescine transport system ATP-binding protein
MDVTVKLHEVSKRLGSVIALDHVSLEIMGGEFFSILGPSGSGKSTLLRIIAGLDAPDEGVIAIQGRAVNTWPPDKRPVNLVFQHYALFPHLSVFDNIAFGLRMRGEPSRHIQDAVGRMMELVRLEGKEGRYPAELSGGEQQRVALARALVNRPVVVLLDEPLAALDQQLRQEMHGELKRLQQEVGSTFICVTHQQDEALMLSDRLAVMSEGKVLQVGTPREIYQSPASTTVATFIGLSNAVGGIFMGDEEKFCWVKHDGLPPLKALTPFPLPASSFVTLMIRPERLTLTVQPNGSPFDNTVSGELVNMGFNGSEVHYHVRLPTGALWTVRVPVAGEPTPRPAVGQQVYMQWFARDGLILST